jgi:prevent-host-death family protein
MQRMSARDAKNGFGRLIDLARAEPVAIEKHGRAVVVVIAFEEYERLAGHEGKENVSPKVEGRSPKGEQ